MDETTTYETIFIARQPVFNTHSETWGYLMLFRNSQDADRAVIADNSEATMNLVANLPLYGGMGGQNSRLLIHFTPADVIAGTPLAVPWSKTVIILEEQAEPSDALLAAIRDFKDDGFELAINNFEGKPGSERLAEMADLLIVDMTDTDETDLAYIAAKGRKLGITRLMAKCVETADDLAKAREAGFTLFHGFFFKRPQTESGRKLTSSEITRLKLFEIIEKDEPDFDSLAPAIEADVAISYRLLNFLNSANFSFAATITSIRQAVVLAGWKPIRNWLRLIILTDMAPSQKSMELSYLSAHRAKLFETAALGGGHEEESDKLFMLGLFSLLDALLDMKMADIVNHLPVDDAIKDALCGEPNQYAPWLALARAIESSDWDAVSATASTLDLLPGTVAVSYQHAFTWADSFFSSGNAEDPVQ